LVANHATSCSKSPVNPLAWRERHALDRDPILGTIKTSELSAELQTPNPEIHMAQSTLLLAVVAGRVEYGHSGHRNHRRRALHTHRHPVGVKLYQGHPDPLRARICLCTSSFSLQAA